MPARSAACRPARSRRRWSTSCGACCARRRSSSRPGGRRGSRTRASPRPRSGRRCMELDPLWDELFPAEQARIVQLLVERVDVGTRRHLASGSGPRGWPASCRTCVGRPPCAGERHERRGRAQPDGSRLTVRVPLTFRRRGGRKVVVAPTGAVIAIAATAGRRHAGEGDRSGPSLAADAGEGTYASIAIWRRPSGSTRPTSRACCG